MSELEDGGPAFPRAASELNYDAEGMSLRDWFAGQALAGLLASGPYDCGPSGIAHDAYQIADAMLTARKETP